MTRVRGRASQGTGVIGPPLQLQLETGSCLDRSAQALQSLASDQCTLTWQLCVVCSISVDGKGRAAEWEGKILRHRVELDTQNLGVKGAAS